MAKREHPTEKARAAAYIRGLERGYSPQQSETYADAYEEALDNEVSLEEAEAWALRELNRDGIYADAYSRGLERGYSPQQAETYADAYEEALDNEVSLDEAEVWALRELKRDEIYADAYNNAIERGDSSKLADIYANTYVEALKDYDSAERADIYASAYIDAILKGEAEYAATQYARDKQLEYETKSVYEALLTDGESDAYARAYAFFYVDRIRVGWPNADAKEIADIYGRKFEESKSHAYARTYAFTYVFAQRNEMTVCESEVKAQGAAALAQTRETAYHLMIKSGQSDHYSGVYADRYKDAISRGKSVREASDYAAAMAEYANVHDDAYSNAMQKSYSGEESEVYARAYTKAIKQGMPGDQAEAWATLVTEAAREAATEANYAAAYDRAIERGLSPDRARSCRYGYERAAKGHGYSIEQTHEYAIHWDRALNEMRYSFYRAEAYARRLTGAYETAYARASERGYSPDQAQVYAETYEDVLRSGLGVRQAESRARQRATGR